MEPSKSREMIFLFNICTSANGRHAVLRFCKDRGGSAVSGGKGPGAYIVWALGHPDDRP